ncbi:helicase domain protein [Nitzschia inconspicua]|uniref:Helicase domain protein n=1 Tax=Nitzschia inconspicua TaxID=303405 RepID=A0A9K3KAV1_9STRA|nr:helicase domain protein [Nitzschia inconspicua]
MDPLFVLTSTTYSNDFPPDCRNDLESLLSFLDKAKDLATLLEPTPIRPDHEMVMSKQRSASEKLNEHQWLSTPSSETTNQFCVSDDSFFSKIFLNHDFEPLDLDDQQANRPSSALSFFEEKTPSHNTGECSCASFRFRKYQSSQWDDRFQELLLFCQEHGHVLVPHSYPPNQKLSQWVKRQRHQYKRKQMGHHSTLTDEREVQLLEAGFIFDSHRAVWQTRFESLKAFRMANGHCKVPTNFEDRSLVIWIKHQRRQYQFLINGEKSTMTEERIAALKSIGFNWNPRKSKV